MNNYPERGENELDAMEKGQKHIVPSFQEDDEDDSFRKRLIMCIVFIISGIAVVIFL